MLISTSRCSPEPSRERQQHVFDDGIRTLAVLDDLFEIAAQRVHQFANLTAPLLVEPLVPEGFLQLINQFGRDRVLDLVRDAGSELTKRGELLRLD